MAKQLKRSSRFRWCRKFVEVAGLMATPGRAHTTIAFIEKLYTIESQIRRLKNDKK